MSGALAPSWSSVLAATSTHTRVVHAAAEFDFVGSRHSSLTTAASDAGRTACPCSTFSELGGGDDAELPANAVRRGGVG